MSRHSKSKSINGWLIVDKNTGYSSASVVNKVKWLLNAKKAGHIGTLDPDASGIIAIALGDATKTIPYVNDDSKTYHFEIHFGSATDTDDVSGSKVKVSNLRPSESQLLSVIELFKGNIKQVPPKYSAIKINGKRAYELSRKGITNFKLKSRTLHIEKLEIIERINENSAKMKLVCGRGGYVRSIARDIGEKLGCFAHAGQIRRIVSGPFTLKNSISAEVIFDENIKDVLGKVLPLNAPLKHIECFTCHLSDANEINDGKKILVKEKIFETNSTAFVCFKDKPIAIGQVINNYFYPKKVFTFVTN